MEEFNGELPVEVQMTTESPPPEVEVQITTESPPPDEENHQTLSELGDPLNIDNCKTQLDPSPTSRKTRRSRRSKHLLQSNCSKMECNLCSFETLEGRGALHIHYLHQHSKEDLASTLISITYPDDVDDSILDMGNHRKNSGTKRNTSLHACPICQKNISGKNNLEKHLIRHSAQKPFKCEECQKMFSAKRDLQLHNMRHHSKERPHVCPTCNKGFVDKAYLKKHITFHDQSRYYVCETCGKSFNNMLGLQKHCKTHSQERPYMCEKCSKCFRVKYDLTVHKRNVHKETALQHNDPDPLAVCAPILKDIEVPAVISQ